MAGSPIRFPANEYKKRMPDFTLARLPAGVDLFNVLIPWLEQQIQKKQSVLWIVSRPELVSQIQERFKNQSVTIVDLQTLADECIQKKHPTARFLQPRHLRLLAAESRADHKQVTHGEAIRIFGTITELKRAGIDSKKWPKNLHGQLENWERARLEMGLLDPDDRILKAAKEWDQTFPSIVISGFSQFTLPEFSLLSAVVKSAKAVALALPQSAPLPAWIDEHDEPDRIEIESIPSPAIHRIQAPGLLGECRLVARQLRKWIDAGIEPNQIVITARHAERLADQLELVFQDYGIPLTGIDPPPLIRTPAVSTLLRAWRLVLDDFPFAGVAELLRSGLFQPNWNEAKLDLDLPFKSEALLRRLGRPSGRESYLAALEQKIVAPLPPLEDEAGDQSRQKRIEAMAGHCKAFLHRFFQMWDNLPAATSAGKWLDRLKQFANEMGLAADEALKQFWSECGEWVKADAPAMKLKRMTLPIFTEIVERIASDTPFQKVMAEKQSAVRLLNPIIAQHTPCEILVVMNLGEGSFPSTSPPISMLSDFDRVGFETELLPKQESRFRAEQELFHALHGRPRQHLVLSRQAVDEKGQELLPSSFLLEWELKNTNLPPAVVQKMPIEGYAEDIAYSASERRVQAARMLRKNPEYTFSEKELPAPVGKALTQAQLLASRRFLESTFSEYDGKITHPIAVEAVKKRFLPERAISPSSLETYLSCPFRFWLEQILRIEVLEEPSPKIEVTRRGQAVHRAMARYHRAVRDGKTDLELPEFISQAASEYGERSGTQLGQVLWLLEGKRLERGARKYAQQWEKFRNQWEDVNVFPSPAKFEQSFGGQLNPLAEVGAEPPADSLVIEVNGVTVKIGGTVDRVDAVELNGERGFWIIDYKTGRASQYTGTAINQMDALQLPLYALAVERTIFKDRPSRPLGLAYWMIGDGGAKTVLPARGAKTWLTEPQHWHVFREQLEQWVVKIVANIRMGMFPLAPKSEQCTALCPFGPTCRIAQARSVDKQFQLT